MTTATLEPLDLVRQAYVQANAITRHMDAELKPTGFTFVQALVVLAITDGDDQPHRLADTLKSHSQSVTGVLDRLERDRYVTRHRDLDDRRAVRLEVTLYDEQVDDLRNAVEAAARKWMEGARP